MIQNDGYMNIFTGLGSERDPITSTAFAVQPILTPAILDAVFSGDGLGRRIVEEPAGDMVREWFNVSAEEGEGVLDYLETLSARQIFEEAAIWSRLYGGAAVVPILQDGMDFSAPLNPDRIASVLGFRVFDRGSVSFGDLPSRDPVKSLRGLPEFYEISNYTSRAVSGQSATFRVHESRLVLIPGKRVPDRVRQMNGGWDDPVLQSAYESLMRYSTTVGYASNIVKDFIQAVLSVKDLTALIASGKEAIVERRLKLLDMGRSILNTMVIDADGESFDKKANSVTGLPDLLDRFAEHLCGCTNFPMSRLLGRSPGGMNSTGSAEMRNYYDFIASEQGRVLGELAEFAVRLSFLAKDGPTGGVEPDAWSVKWNSLQQPTDKEVADLRKVVADTDKVYVDAGVLSPQEIAESRFGSGDWSMATQLATDTERNPVASMDPEDAAALMAPSAEEEDHDAERKDASPLPLYVRRDVLNKKELTDWFKNQGLETVLEDLHITVLYSKTPVDWFKMGDTWQEEVEIPAGGPRAMEKFGDALVLLVASSHLSWRHEEMVRLGASHDYPDYQPHVTISYKSGDKQVEPYRGKILLGPEIFEEIKEAKLFLKEDSGEQPRVPKGSPEGGQFAGKLRGAVSALVDHPNYLGRKKNPLLDDEKRWSKDPASAAVYKFAKENGPWPEKSVPISKINSDQDSLDAGHMLKLADGHSSGELPIVLDRGDNGFRVIDGNHRIAIAKLRGDEEIKVQVLSAKNEDLEKYLIELGADKYEIRSLRGDEQ